MPATRGLGLLLALVASALCVRLGFWQLGRLEEKRALNRRLRESLAGPVVPLAGGEPWERVAGRRVAATGVYDSLRHVVLRGRARRGAPGVELLTPLRLEGAPSAVLVDRGWLPAPDAATARPQDYPERGRVQAVGVVEAGQPAREPPRLRVAVGAGGMTRITVSALALDSLRGYFPYPLAGFVLRQLPDSSLPPLPSRAAPAFGNENMHLSYAVQWFSFATIIAVGAGALALRGRGPRP